MGADDEDDEGPFRKLEVKGRKVVLLLHCCLFQMPFVIDGPVEIFEMNLVLWKTFVGLFRHYDQADLSNFFLSFKRLRPGNVISL